MSNGYTKLFNSILHSTVWGEDNSTRIVWITMLAMCDKHGCVNAAVPGLARAANVSLEDTENALRKFLSVDPYSRTPDHEGRRIESVQGGWVLLNHAKYRAMLSAEERKEYNRNKQAEHRARNKKSIAVNDNQSQSAMSAHTDTDTKADTKRKQPTTLSPNDDVSEEQKCSSKEPSASSSSTVSSLASDAASFLGSGSSTSKTANGSPPASKPISVKIDPSRATTVTGNVSVLTEARNVIEQVFQQQWNLLGKPFSKIADWTDKRKKAFKSRWNDPFFVANWKEALGKIKVSKFCRGESEQGTWIVDVDFFLTPSGFTKIMEGKYDNRDGPTNRSPPSRSSSIALSALADYEALATHGRRYSRSEVLSLATDKLKHSERHWLEGEDPDEYDERIYRTMLEKFPHLDPDAPPVEI